MNQIIDLSVPKGAIFSEDRKYRYALWRVWNPSGQGLMVCGLNPSTADERLNDPTVTRVITRAERAGYGSLFMANLFALVSTDPKALLNNSSAVGEMNDYYIRYMVDLSKIQLCGWGSFKPVPQRSGVVFGMLREPYCLGVNQDGQPKHPLYIGYDVPMVKYQGRSL